MWRRVVIVCSFLIFAGSALANESDVFSHPATAEAVQRALKPELKAMSEARVLRGNFTQKKYLSGFPRPLQASGAFMLVRGVGVLWHQRAPFDSRLTLSAKELSVRQNGRLVQQIKAQDQPGLRLAAGLFSSLIGLDVKNLDESFHLFLLSDHAQWKLGLSARQDALRMIADRIVLSGNDRVEEVSLLAKNGDRTVIRFSSVKASNQPPTASELAVFKGAQ